MRLPSISSLTLLGIFCLGGAVGGCSPGASADTDSDNPSGDGDAANTGGTGAGTGGTGAGTGGTGAGTGGTGAGTGGTIGGTGGSATGGAGTGGGATGGSGTGGGGVADCSSLPLCTSFDTDTVGSVPPGFTAQLDYGNNGPAANVAVSTGAAHSGTQSVKVVTGTGLYGLKYAPTGDAYYMRAWLKIEGLGAGNPVIVGVGPDSNSEVRMRLFQESGSPLYVTANAASGDGLSPIASSDGNAACAGCVAVPAEWFCLQMHVDKATETLQFWVDDVQAVNVQNNTPWHSGATWPATVSSVRIGALPLGGSGPTAVYIDDLAFGPGPIACN